MTSLLIVAVISFRSIYMNALPLPQSKVFQNDCMRLFLVIHGPWRLTCLGCFALTTLESGVGIRRINQSHSSFPIPLRERKTWPSAILNENEASVSASVVLIHTRSEDSSDSDSDSNSASVTKVNQALTRTVR